MSMSFAAICGINVEPRQPRIKFWPAIEIIQTKGYHADWLSPIEHYENSWNRVSATCATVLTGNNIGKCVLILKERLPPPSASNLR